MANRERGRIDGEDVCWRWKDIFEKGSEELQEFVKIITGSHPPGVPVKGDTKHESN